jgi:hypothetical protein
MLRRMRGSVKAWLTLVVLLGSACGTQGGKSPDQREALPDDDSAADVEQSSVPMEDKKHKKSGDETGKGPAAEPEFKDGMSVDDAINAIPAGTQRVNIDQETLGEPLKEQKTWSSCKLTPADHFKVNVAIWNGHAVGVDVDSKNKRVADCVKQAVRSVVWRDKVRSLNTVEYAQ